MLHAQQAYDITRFFIVTPNTTDVRSITKKPHNYDYAACTPAYTTITTT